MTDMKTISEQVLEARSSVKSFVSRCNGFHPSYVGCSACDESMKLVTKFETIAKDNAEPLGRAYLELLEKNAVLDNTLSNVLNYLHWNTDALSGDDLIGDKRLTRRFNEITSEIEKARAIK